jgi:hypothetical protein
VAQEVHNEIWTKYIEPDKEPANSKIMMKVEAAENVDDVNFPDIIKGPLGKPLTYEALKGAKSTINFAVCDAPPQVVIDTVSSFPDPSLNRIITVARINPATNRIYDDNEKDGHDIIIYEGGRIVGMVEGTLGNTRLIQDFNKIISKNKEQQKIKELEAGVAELHEMPPLEVDALSLISGKNEHTATPMKLAELTKARGATTEKDSASKETSLNKVKNLNVSNKNRDNSSKQKIDELFGARGRLKATGFFNEVGTPVRDSQQNADKNDKQPSNKESEKPKASAQVPNVGSSLTWRKDPTTGKWGSLNRTIQTTQQQEQSASPKSVKDTGQNSPKSNSDGSAENTKMQTSTPSTAQQKSIQELGGEAEVQNFKNIMSIWKARDKSSKSPHSTPAFNKPNGGINPGK